MCDRLQRWSCALLVLSIAVCRARRRSARRCSLPAEFREIVNGSDIIAYGRVVETAVEWSDDRKHVDTLVTLSGRHLPERRPGRLARLQGAGRHDRTLPQRAGRRAAIRRRRRGRAVPQQPRPRAAVGVRSEPGRLPRRARPETRRRMVTPPLAGARRHARDGGARRGRAPAAAARDVRRAGADRPETTPRGACDEARRTAASGRAGAAGRHRPRARLPEARAPASARGPPT